jgi:PPOX class probable F420-dependent enzyme
MQHVIPEKYQDLLQKKTVAMLGTVMADGSPQVTPVWFDVQHGEIWVNTAAGRQKHVNVQRDPRVAVTVVDPDNTYRYVEMRGRVREMTEDGAAAHIDKMAHKYLGVDKYPWHKPTERRVLLKVTIERAVGMG